MAVKGDCWDAKRDEMELICGAVKIPVRARSCGVDAQVEAVG